MNNRPHDGEKYLTDEQKGMLVKQTTLDKNYARSDHFIYGGKDKDISDDLVNIVLMEVEHYYSYDNYNGPKIAYNVWESTLYPDDFFKKLLEFDQLWVPSNWQRDCVIKQGMNPNMVKVVPEGVEGNIFYPEKVKRNDILEEYKDNRFKFILFGRWDYRKSINEIIGAFLKTFDKKEKVDLVISVDNQFSTDGMKNTEERLLHYGFNDPRIKVKHFPSRDEYIKYLKTGHVFVSCARSEGWNLPLCVPKGKKVICNDDMVSVEDVKENDIVPTHKNHRQEVIKTMKRHYNGDMVKIKVFNDFEEINVTPEHPIYVIKRERFITKKDKFKNIQNLEPEWIKSIDIKKGDLIIKSCVDENKKYNNKIVDLLQIDNRLLFNNDKVWYKTGYNGKGILKKYNRFIALKDLSYILGWYIAEGCDGKSKCILTLNILEENIAREWLKQIENIFGVRGSYTKYKTKIQVRVSSTLIAKFFSKLCGENAHCKKIPKEILYGAGEILKELIDEYAKGDGHNNGRSISCSTVSYLLARQLLIGNQRINRKSSLHKNGRGEYIISWCLNNMDYRHSNKSWWHNGSDIAQLVKNVSVEEYDGYVYNFEVKNDNSYILLNGTVHNCEAMACGTPSIYSNWGAQLEFADGKGLPVNIKGEQPARSARFLDEFPGNYCEPDFDHLSKVMRDAYENYDNHKEKAIEESIEIREKFSWENAVKKAMVIIEEMWCDKQKEYIVSNFIGHGGWWEAIKTEVYDKRIYEKYFSIKEGDIVVDIGSHAGFFALTCVGRKVNKCYCVEPFAVNIEDLKRNISLTDEEDKFIVVEKAIDIVSEVDKFNYSEDMGVTGKHSNSDTIEISTISFLDFVEENKISYIDFLKFDCEGGEYAIINDEKNWEYLRSNVGKMVGEIHIINGREKEAIKLINNIENMGFEVILNSVDGLDITKSFYTNTDYYNQIHIYAKKTELNNIVFITGASKEYMPFAKMCVQNLSEFTNIPIMTYGYNCDVDFDCPNIIKKRVDFNRVKQIDGHIDTTYYFAKIQSCIDAIDSGKSNYYIWIDSDTIPSANISKVFNYVEEVENYPLCMRYNDQTSIHWKKIEGEYYEALYGEEVCSLYNVKPGKNGWKAAVGLFIFTKESRWFFEEVLKTGEEVRNLSFSKVKKDKLGNNLFIDDNAFSEERIVNMLFWENGFNNCLPVTWISKSWESNGRIGVGDLPMATDILKRFADEDYDIMFIFPEEHKKKFQLLPYSEEDIVFFHSKPKQKDLLLTNELGKMYRDDVNNSAPLLPSSSVPDGEVKLNLGCGDDLMEGYINIDLYNPNAEVQVDIRKLPYGDDSVDEVFSSHALEHFSKHETIPILTEWNRVLKSGSRLIMNLPDLEWCMLNWLNTPERDKWEWAVDSIFGHQMAEGEVHQAGFTKSRLEYLLTTTGYNNISVVNHQSHGQTCFLIHANKV